MTDEEKQENKSLLARAAEGAIDGFARKSPMLGGALQAAVNTDEYKAKQSAQEAQRLNNQVAIDEAKFRLSDDYRNARSAQLQADTETANTKAMLANEERSDLAIQERTTGRQAKIAQNNRVAKANELDMDAMDDQQHAARIGNQQKNLENELSNNPMYGMMTFDEKRAFMQSPAIRNMLDASVYMEDITSMASGDKNAFGRLDRALNRQGWDLKQGEDGIMYLDMGNGNVIPATRESIDGINQMIHNAALEELQARSDISMTASLGNPARRNQAKYANALMPYNNNSAAQSVRSVQSVYNNATDEQKTWTFFNQAIQDWADPTVPTSSKMAEFQACVPFLQQLGYAVEGFDEKNPSMDSVMLKNGKQILSFSQFADLCKANDVISAQLDDMVARNARQFGREQMVKAIQNEKDTAKAVKGEEETPEDRMTKTFDEIKGDLARQFKIDFRALSDEQQDAVAMSYYKIKLSLTDYFADESVGSVSELSDDTLKKIDMKWKQMMEEAGIKSGDPIYNNSPVQDEISRRAKEKAEREKQEEEKRREENHKKWQEEEKATNKKVVQEAARTSPSAAPAYMNQRNDPYTESSAFRDTTTKRY